MMKKITIIISLFCLVLSVSCELGAFDESFQENPNLLTPDQADPNFVLNNVQIDVADLIQDLNRTTDEVMRYTYLNESYTDVASPGSLNAEYRNYYAFLQDATIIDAAATASDDFLFHRGMATILNSYATVMMVDYLGDIPFSEAVRSGEMIFNPKPDDASTIYATLLGRLDNAIIDLTNAIMLPTNDLFYDGDASKWIKLAKSLQFKMLVNMGDTARINALILENDLIEPADDFQFQYGTNAVDPNSRHPDFNTGYPPAGGFNQFLGNDFLNLLLNDKSIPDPRLRYYVYRQNSADPSDVLLGCVDAPNFDFCYLENSYYGRDHGDDRPRSTDAVFRATYGLYPVGGAFDADNPTSNGATSIVGQGFAIDAPNQLGAGILPILLSSYLDFLRAEVALTLGTDDDATVLLESAIRKSMNKVMNFPGVPSGSEFLATPDDVEAYITEVMTSFASADDEGKLEIVLKEYYLASYGNSTESYNGYRRTGFPSTLNSPIFDSNTPFPRVFSYPLDAVNSNNQLNQQPITTQIFWDTNPAGFIK